MFMFSTIHLTVYYVLRNKTDPFSTFLKPFLVKSNTRRDSLLSAAVFLVVLQITSTGLGVCFRTAGGRPLVHPVTQHQARTLTDFRQPSLQAHLSHYRFTNTIMRFTLTQ